MPKTGTPLSATAVRNLKEPGKYYDLHGLFLRIEPTGSRRWVQRVSVAGRQREIGLGSADLVTLAEARELAVSNKKLARAGGDPLAAKQERIAIPSLDAAIDKCDVDFLEEDGRELEASKMAIDLACELAER